MAKVVGDVAVEVSADVGPLRRGMTSASGYVKGFGRDFERESQKMEMMAGRVALAIGAITVAAGALGSAAQYVFNHAKEIENLSVVAGVGVERFQSLSFAVAEFGVEQDKLADILKDVNDKMGDYVATGGGPLADFFENIAPKIGVTIEQFQRLNSADALALYVKTLQDANVSQSEMTFYMEAIANDATRLVPVLADNASEMKRLEQNARDLGAVIGEDVVFQTSRMGDVWGRIVSGMQAQFVAMASTVLTWFDDMLGLTEVGQFNKLADELYAQTKELKIMEEQLSRTLESRTNGMVFGNTDVIERELRVKIADQKALINISNANLDELEYQATRRREILNELADPTPIPSGGGGGGGGGSGGSAKDRESDAQLDRLRDQFASERELIQQDYDEKLTMLNDFLEAKKISQEEYNAYIEQIQADHNEAMRQLEEQKRTAMLNGLGGMFNDLSTLMQTENEKLFKIGKAAAIAEATVSGYKAAVDAWEKGMKIGGPPVAAAFTAASLAKTGALISSIASTSYSGGSASTPGTTGGAGSTTEAAPQPLLVRMEQVDPGAFVSGQVVNDLFQQLQDEAGDRGVVFATAGT